MLLLCFEFIQGCWWPSTFLTSEASPNSTTASETRGNATSRSSSSWSRWRSRGCASYISPCGSVKLILETKNVVTNWPRWRTGALGITIGYRFRSSCLAFIVPFWYILILDKTSWNNHSYLFGLLSILLLFSSANHYWSRSKSPDFASLRSCWRSSFFFFFSARSSVDGLSNPALKNKAVPNWNYLLLKFQIFLLYFYAGVKKIDGEWLGGYSMRSTAGHWVFNPFKYVNIDITTSDRVEFDVITLNPESCSAKKPSSTTSSTSEASSSTWPSGSGCSGPNLDPTPCCSVHLFIWWTRRYSLLVI